MRRKFEQRDQAPHDQYHHHNRGDLHNLHGLITALVDTLSVLPPEIQDDQNSESSRKTVLWQLKRVTRIPADVFDESR